MSMKAFAPLLTGLLATVFLVPARAGEPPDCAAVFFVMPRGLFGPYNSRIAEVFIQEASSETSTLHGILMNGDWGALEMCTPSFSATVRWFGDPLGHAVRKFDSHEISVNRAGRSVVYLNLDSWSEMSQQEGLAHIDRIEKFWGFPPWMARWNFDKDRYDQICLSCGVGLRPPEAAGLRK